MHCVFMGSKVLVDFSRESFHCMQVVQGISGIMDDLLQKREESSLLQFQGEGPLCFTFSSNVFHDDKNWLDQTVYPKLCCLTFS